MYKKNKEKILLTQILLNISKIHLVKINKNLVKNYGTMSEEKKMLDNTWADKQIQKQVEKKRKINKSNIISNKIHTKKELNKKQTEIKYKLDNKLNYYQNLAEYVNYKIKYKSEFTYKKTNHRQQWDNSIYSYNNGKVINISQQKRTVNNIISSYFNLYNQKTENKANIIQTWTKYRKRFSNKIFFNFQNEKHTNKAVVLTLLIYNRSDRYIINLLKSNKLDIFYKTRNYYNSNTIKSILKKKNFFSAKFISRFNDLKKNRYNFLLFNKNKQLYNPTLLKKKIHLQDENTVKFKQNTIDSIDFILSKIKDNKFTFSKNIFLKLKNLHFSKISKKLKNSTTLNNLNKVIYIKKINKKSNKVTYIPKIINKFIGMPKIKGYNLKKKNIKPIVGLNNNYNVDNKFTKIDHVDTYNSKNLFKLNKKLNYRAINRNNKKIDSKNIITILNKILVIFKDRKLTYLTQLLKDAFNIIHENQQTKHKRHQKLMVYYKHIIQINKFKFENVFLTKLKNILSGIYKKNVKFNIINLKYPNLDSTIYTEVINLKAKSRKFSIRTILNRAMEIPVKKVRSVYEYKNDRKVYELTKNTDMVKKIVNIFILPKQKNCLSSSSTDIVGNTLNKNFAYKKHNDINKYVIDNLNNKYIKGIKIQAKGRLTKRLTASRAVFKYAQKGSIRNFTSSYLGQYGYLLRNQVDCNVQYTKLISKTRNGAFGLKGWISSI